MLSADRPVRPSVRRYIRVRGQVQGVGFRPFVYHLAIELGLSGWVRNDAQGVEIEAQGDPRQLDQLLARLKAEAPLLARIDGIECRSALSRDARQAPDGETFYIDASRVGEVRTGITPDAATCHACLAELFDPDDRRYRYPFINCTHCGPRYTITTALPYDRPNTSMAAFTMCPACQVEYDVPLDRRFHAQPNACPVCGPGLSLRGAEGALSAVDDVVTAAVDKIRAGEILAIKGLGGFHLACDARNAAAVARLRERKHREEKPFAVMFANIESMRAWVTPGDTERGLLESPEHPVVLLRKNEGCDGGLAGVAPGVAWLGAMLPYTPLHYLLFHEAAGRPSGTEWLAQPQDLVLVMTSANPGGEPLVTGNQEALRRLRGIADGFVLHDRDIRVRCDDSVMRVKIPGLLEQIPPSPPFVKGGEGTAYRLAKRGEGEISGGAIRPASPAISPPFEKGGIGGIFIRRARGYTPRAIKLARSGPSVLACGGWLKNTVCLTRGNEAFVSQHIGDLDNAPTCEALEQAVAHLMEVLEIEPQLVAHDLHPDFFSSRFAANFAAERNIDAIAVQHHHAHIASVMAEHRLTRPVLGLALDGVGLGADGGIWGGELLRVDGVQCERLGHLRPLALPGGDRAAREPWRMAAAALHALGRGGEITRRFAHPGAAMVAEMLEKRVSSPLTSSVGRLFDAAAGLLRIKDFMRFEGQAAMLLEGLAEKHGRVAPLPDGYILLPGGMLDMLPLLDHLADLADPALGAALFHATFAQALAAWVQRAAEATSLRDVAFGGGCFLNHVLSTALREQLARSGLRVYEAAQLPPNDGGLSLGQAWVAILTVGHTVGPDLSGLR